jgi:hypothetical protein
MMDYFVLKQDDRQTAVPELLDVRSRLDVRELREAKAHLMPDTMLFDIREERERPDYTDYMDRQLPLMSERMKQVVELYEPRSRFKMAVLIDRRHHSQQVYYVPLIQEVEALSPETSFHRDGETIKELILRSDSLQGKKILRIKESVKPLYIIRLDVAESLLRRDMTGIRLERARLDEGSCGG